MPSCNTYHLTWVSLTLAWGISSRLLQPLLLTLDEGYLLTTTVPDLQRGIAPLGPPVPAQPRLLRLLLLATGPGLGHWWLLPDATPDLGRRPTKCRWLRASSLSTAERSYPTSEVRGSGLECQAVTAQERLRGATSHWRSGAWPREATLLPRSVATAGRSYPASEVREGIGHSKHFLPTTQEKSLHMDIIRWPTLKSD